MPLAWRSGGPTRKRRIGSCSRDAVWYGLAHWRELIARFFDSADHLATLGRNGTVVPYAGNTENPVFTFRLGQIGVASTSLYSIDRSLFQLAATGATERRLVRPGLAVTLEADGSPGIA